MLDATARRVLERPLDAVAGGLTRVGWMTPDRMTVVGLVVGLASAAAAAQRWWTVALALWLASRLADGLDGPLARRLAASRAPSGDGARPPSQAGGFLDISADFVVYGTTVVGVAVGAGGSPWPFVAVLLAYYVNGSVFLAFSSVAERTGRTIDDGRSLSFLGGLAEGTETVAVHALWCLVPAAAGRVATVWAVVVGISAAHRIWAGYRALR
ncbi:CDP-alcohol phosphatidyltransferase family protein [Kineosporia sp. R_H_3]|uniref:CDP-alcohol phosphatidyltransferase family protein n=1 Tax=Kineosporia sp. R_H_3 TaxID=1961848 RepID=UPI000B4B2701|nr:CDP-alcohol phosphatidyltransferase family protein [Kineosporia sp. R_H_3]